MGTKRDTLAWICFLVHVAVLAYVILGWSIPVRPWLLLYLIFLPAMVLHWKFNSGACILNNLENWLRLRRWRAPESNPEEGAWLRTLLANATSIGLSQGQMDAVIYSAVGLFWLLGLARFQGEF